MNRCMLVIATLVLVPGCQRVIYDQIVSLETGDERTIHVDPIAREQQLDIEFLSKGTPINIYVALSKDQGEVHRSLGQRQKSDKLLDSKEDVEEGKMQIKVPANEELAVILSNPGTKNAAIRLKIAPR